MLSTILERLSVRDRVSVSETLLAPALETLSVNDIVSNIGISAALEMVSVSDSVSDSETTLISLTPVVMSVRDNVSDN